MTETNNASTSRNKTFHREVTKSRSQSTRFQAVVSADCGNHSGRRAAAREDLPRLVAVSRRFAETTKRLDLVT